MGVSEYFAQSHLDDGVYSDGVPQFDVVADNGIFTLNPLNWNYETMWYADALLPTTEGQSVYQMGPTAYDLSSYYGSIYFEKGDGKMLCIAAETARLDSQENTDEYFLQGLTYFSQWGTGSGSVSVTDIIVSGEGGETTITEDGGTLQMMAEVLPENATINSVFWTVTQGTGYATINSDGVLKSTGSDYGNGTVWAVATAADGSAVVDSLEITISNQGTSTGYKVLLVNDNAREERYFEIDTILSNIETPVDFKYDIYNAAEIGVAPGYPILSAYDLVIWYTGNDGVDLYLWDTSDTNNYKFNVPLVEYMNQGGDIWLQGLDFIYDVVGSAPVEFTEGQFIYDVVGISNYAIQTHADDEDTGLVEMDVVIDNPVCELTPVNWTYETLWYADGYELTPNAVPIYKLGPSGYMFDFLYCGLLNNIGDSHLLTYSTEGARFNTRDMGEIVFTEAIEYFKSLTSIYENPGNSFTIENVYPNPTNNNTTFAYELSNNSNVTLMITDITGKVIMNTNYGSQSKGSHNIIISANDLNMNNGIYFYTLKINDGNFSGKLLITK